MSDISIEPVTGKRDFAAFVDFAYAINAGDPNWVPPLRAEVVELLTPGKNPFHEHAKVQLFLARRAGRVVGRISAHYDELALTQPPEQGMGPGTGNWGLFEAEDEAVAHALIACAEQWLREQGMTRVLAPISLSIWEEPGLLVTGHDHPPMVMMGHNRAEYEAWIERAGYAVAKRLLTYDLPVGRAFRRWSNRIVASGEKNERIPCAGSTRTTSTATRRSSSTSSTTPGRRTGASCRSPRPRKAYGAKKLAPLIIEGANMIAEIDGEPVAFMMALPDVNAADSR
jgi:hypothetical protein